MNVVFIGTGYMPDREERQRLATLQEYVTYARAGLENRIRKLHPADQHLERQIHFNYFREKIKALPSREWETQALAE